MLSPHAEIQTLSGNKIAADLVDAGPTHVFTWDGERVTVGQIEVTEDHRLQIPRRIELDDGNGFSCCVETMVLSRSGGPRFLDQLQPGDSLLPFYLKTDAGGYPVYQEPGDWHLGALTPSDKNRWRRLSRLVAEWKLGRRCEIGDVVSYVSSDRQNVHPSNLRVSRKTRKKTKKKVEFAEPIFEAQRFIDQHNHKVVGVYLDTSHNLLSIRGLRTANLAVNGVFISVDPE